MHGGVDLFLERINILDLRTKVQYLGSFGLHKASTELSLSFNLLLDKLVYRHVKHVVFDCEIRAGNINFKAFLVIDKNDSSFE